MHIGRSFTGTRVEDTCPCPKAPCGLVVFGEFSPECTEHPPERMKTMRQGHGNENCPAIPANSCPSCFYAFDEHVLTDGEPTCPGCGRTARWYAEKDATRR